MLKVGDRVKEKGRGIGTVVAIHTKGTADVLFDDMEYAIRRQEHQLIRIGRSSPYRRNGEVVPFKKKSRKLTKRMRAALPDSDFCDIYTRKDGSERRAFPINDKYHGRLALQYATWPNNARKRQKVKRCVFARYPSLIEWWNNTPWVQDHPEEYYEREYRRVANPHHPMHIHWKDVNGGPYRNIEHMRLNPRYEYFDDESEDWELYSEDDDSEY